MIYSVNITTPANTAQTAMQETALTLCEGMIYRIEVHFPHGNCGNHGLKICKGSVQMYPTNEGDYFVGSGEVIAFDDLYLFDQPPYLVSIYTYNQDTTNDQDVQVYIGIVLARDLLDGYLPYHTNQQLLSILSEIRDTLFAMSEPVLPEPIIPIIMPRWSI